MRFGFSSRNWSADKFANSVRQVIELCSTYQLVAWGLFGQIPHCIQKTIETPWKPNWPVQFNQTPESFGARNRFYDVGGRTVSVVGIWKEQGSWDGRGNDTTGPECLDVKRDLERKICWKCLVWTMWQFVKAVEFVYISVYWFWKRQYSRSIGVTQDRRFIVPKEMISRPHHRKSQSRFSIA